MGRVARIVLVAMALALVVAIYTGDIDIGDASPTTPSLSAPPTTQPLPPAGHPSSDPLTQLAALTVANETSRDGYSRDLFPHWADPDDNGCDARQDALIAQALGPVQRDPFGCHVVEGDWYSVFDAVSHSGPAEDVDIDHVVSLAEAWDSGAGTWTEEERRDFANDPANLLVVTATSNRSKGDSDVAEWQPPRHDAWCLTATITIQIKTRWKLSIDQAEHQRLDEMARTCGQDGQQPHPAER
jgi:hypothetical protein